VRFRNPTPGVHESFVVVPTVRHPFFRVNSVDLEKWELFVDEVTLPIKDSDD